MHVKAPVQPRRTLLMGHKSLRGPDTARASKAPPAPGGAVPPARLEVDIADRSRFDLPINAGSKLRSHRE